MTTTTELACRCCDGWGFHSGRGLIHACYQRYRKAGTLDQFPPLNAWTVTLGRIDDFAELRQRGVSVKAAARRVGVGARSGQRYEQRLKARQAVTS